jgi:tellurite resistance protein TerC
MMSLYLFEAIYILLFFIVDCIMFVKIKHFSFRGAILNFLFWIAVTLTFFAIVYFSFSQVKASEFLAGYILERTLSFDNIFVFYIIFKFFKLEGKSQERILFWGIIMAIIMRAIFIFLGAVLIQKFGFIMYFFGAFLIFTGIKMVITKESETAEFDKNLIVRALKKIFPTTNQVDGDKFTIKINGKTFFTPVFIVLILIAFIDVVFALDSIPAIFGITLDPFIIVTANFFSLMGLRAIFSLITIIIQRFYYIKYALSLILVFVGIKMLIANFYHVPVGYSLGFIFVSIFVSIIFSIFKNHAK